MTCLLTPFSDRLSPLPALKWANPQEVWKLMCHKDEISSQERDENLFSKHPGLQPRMRAILLDWLIEVSCVTSGWHSSPLPSFLAYPFPLHRVPHSCFPLPSFNRSWPRERPTLLAKGLGFYLRTCPHLSALNWFLMYSFS
jgi:hypothetical protein